MTERERIAIWLDADKMKVVEDHSVDSKYPRGRVIEALVEMALEHATSEGIQKRIKEK